MFIDFMSECFPGYFSLLDIHLLYVNKIDNFIALFLNFSYIRGFFLMLFNCFVINQKKISDMN